MGGDPSDVIFNLADYFLFDRIAGGLGDAVALRFGDAAWTYADKRRAALRSQPRRSSSRGASAPEEQVLTILPDVPPYAWAFGVLSEASAVVAMGNPTRRRATSSTSPGTPARSVVVTVPRVVEAPRSRSSARPGCAPCW